MNLRKYHWQSSIVLLIVGIALLLVALWHQSTPLAIPLAVAITAVASYTPVGSRRSKKKLKDE